MTPLLNIEEAAAVLRVLLWSLRKAVTARKVPFTRVGKHVRFSEDHIAEIIAAGEQRPASAPTRTEVSATRAAAPRRRRRAA